MAGWTDRRYHLGTNEEALGLMTPVLTKGSDGAVLPAHHRTRSDLQGEVTIEDKGETTMDWEDKKNTIWTDGSRLDGEGAGAAAMWWRKGGDTPPPWTGQGTGRRYTPQTIAADPSDKGGREGITTLE